MASIRHLVSLVLLLTLPTRMLAQAFTDAASYDAWKASISSEPVQGTGPVGEAPASERSSCDCWVEPDASYNTVNNQTQWNASGFQNADDGSYGPINLPFAFQLYGTFYNQVYININGNLSFGQSYGIFSSTGFPVNNYPMVAPFWADVDLRGPGAGNNIVRFKVTPTALYVNWINVGYYSMQVDKRNTFQVIITNTTDPIVPNGANVSFCYQDMQWTTGAASCIGGNTCVYGGVTYACGGGAGVGPGFCGAPATVGANRGNGINYMQFGRFNHPGTDYDGPFGGSDGVDWLDGKHFLFNTIQTSANVPPVLASTSACDSVIVCVGETTTLEVSYLSPEPGQITVPNVTAPTLSNFTILNASSGNTGTITGQFTPTIADVGYHVITFSGADNGSPALTSTLEVNVHVLPVSVLDTVDLAVCDDGPPVVLYDLFNGGAQPGGTWTDPIGSAFPGTFTPGSDGDGYYVYTESSTVTVCPSIGVVNMLTNYMDHVLSTAPTLCNGSAEGSITVSTSGNAGPWDYAWTDDAGNAIGAGSGATSTYTGAAGNYTVVITEGVNGAGCSDTLTAEIVEPDPLQWDAVPQDTLICLTGTGLLGASAFGGTGTITLQWSHGASGAGPHGVSPSDTTEYSVIATDSNGCILGPVSATIEVRPAFTLDPLIDDTTCFNIPVLYRATGYSGGDGAYQFDWGNGPQPLDSLWTLPPLSTTICVTISDGCETPHVTRCAWLEVLHVPVTVLASDTTFGCVPFTVNFALRDTTEGADILWHFGDGAQLLDDSVVAHTYEAAGNFNVSLFITWPNGCATDTTAYNMIRTLTVPTALLSWLPHSPTINDPRVQFTDQSVPNAVSWWWDFGEFGTSEEQDPLVEYPDDVGGTYPVMLVVANELGCTDTIRTWVDVHDEFMVWVPNTFTPNGVEPNETFWISGNDLSPDDFEMLVFDRWGHVVYSTTELDFRWDGTKDGSPLPQGVYPYRLKVHALSTPKKRIIHGHVNLLR
jgi:gliding motility-associated-like protein